MHHSQTNVKFLLSTLAKSEKAAESGVKYEKDVASGVEGTLRSLTQRNQKRVEGPIPQLLQGATVALDIKPQAFYNATTEFFRDDIADYLRDGIFLSITHKRHGQTNGWVAQKVIKKYIVTYIEDADGFGDLTVYLKERGAK